ncbi:protein phosphatase 2C domain-containing protein [[Mycobacterium] kokjensenii]|uniref:Protein phosphatase 2C domain-containing protein n=1 Tax=[Mycobacterium] kokjensenii TaxID=3064287 RepID=A0ABM9L640_9MYCO|nr:protein phosphatase 2C domain-containing protein [Mycolicibacter sp. MU0083]CAJ1492960.1 protein phosphatase 2C domain-containing protein [Mycolicibacter sp. MU0083]
MSLVLRYAARSDRGLVRSNNEDSVYAGARLLALADGMGGHAAGEVASQLVIAALAHLDDDEPGGDLLAKLESAVQEGNSAIAAYVEEHPELDGMGTTLTTILFAAPRLGLAHIGDSRGYLLRDGELTQITKDDTFVQTLVDEGRITAEEAHSHPQRSLIMRALTGHEVEPTLTMREAQAGDRYLLCSDGLSDPVSTETIHEALQIPDVNECALRLIELALRGGGPDNVTVVVADVVDVDYGQTQPILAGAVSDADDDHTIVLNTAAGRASAIAPRKTVAKRVLPRIETTDQQPKSRRRRILIGVLLLALLATALFVGRAVIRTNYYVTADGDRVAIMRGVQGSILGYPLQEAFLLGCLDSDGELVQISVHHSGDPGCRLMTLQDLTPPARQQVSNGLPAGTLDDAINQLRSLARSSLLPRCPHGPARLKDDDPDWSPGPAPSTSASPTPSRQPSAGLGPTGPLPGPPPTQTSGRPQPPALSDLPPAPPVPGTDCRAGS